MEVVFTKQDARRRSAAVAAKGPRLTMYSTPPEEEVTLEEFEGVAIDRLRGATSPAVRSAGRDAAFAVRCGVRAPRLAAGRAARGGVAACCAAALSLRTEG
jgi:hypothetical protein